MVLLHAWQRDERGGLRRKTFDQAAIPPGWYDAPDKVPGPAAPEPPAPIIVAEREPTGPVPPGRGRPRRG